MHAVTLPVNRIRLFHCSNVALLSITSAALKCVLRILRLLCILLKFVGANFYVVSLYKIWNGAYVLVTKLSIAVFFSLQ